jgi:hypothetical protein
MASLKEVKARPVSQFLWVILGHLGRPHSLAEAEPYVLTGALLTASHNGVRLSTVCELKVNFSAFV